MSDRSVATALAWTAALRRPEDALGWSLADWDRVVRLARRLRLLARLAESLGDAGLLDTVPAGPRRHLRAEQRLSRFRLAALGWALERVDAALADLPGPRVLLKGAAYVGQGLPIARGRLPSDLDILVPRAALDATVARLHDAGWRAVALDAHDRRYYAEWSHEVPPMRHAVHPIELDLHHDILPPVARDRVDIDLLLARLQPSGRPGWSVFDPHDQILHSAAHLFFDSELRDRVRDLVDLDGLLRRFAADATQGTSLAERAHELGLVLPLALALRFCGDWLATPLPAPLVAALPPLPKGLSACYARVLAPREPGAGEPWAVTLAAWRLLVRHHWRRLPPRLLVPHLWHKLRGGPADGGRAASED